MDHVHIMPLHLSDEQQREMTEFSKILLEDSPLSWVHDVDKAHGYVIADASKDAAFIVSEALKARKPMMFVEQGISVLAGLSIKGESVEISFNPSEQVSGGDILVEPGALIKRVTGQLEGSVLGRHYVVKEFGPDIAIAARNKNNQVIALQWSDISAPRSFVLGLGWDIVQAGIHSPFGGRLLKHFLLEAQAAHLLL